MSLTNSPSLKEYKDGSKQKICRPAPRKQTFRILLLVLLFIALGLLFAQFLQNDMAALLTGKGSISGRIVDENGLALSAQVFVFGVDRPEETDSNGNFTYTNIPAGDRSLIVTYNGAAQEFIVQVQAGSSIDLGNLSFPVATPTIQP